MVALQGVMTPMSLLTRFCEHSSSLQLLNWEMMGPEFSLMSLRAFWTSVGDLLGIAPAKAIALVARTLKMVEKRMMIRFEKAERGWRC